MSYDKLEPFRIVFLDQGKVLFSAGQSTLRNFEGTGLNTY